MEQFGVSVCLLGCAFVRGLFVYLSFLYFLGNISLFIVYCLFVCFCPLFVWNVYSLFACDYPLFVCLHVFILCVFVCMYLSSAFALMFIYPLFFICWCEGSACGGVTGFQPRRRSGETETE